ncbi:acyl carrier protein [Microbispora sp. NBC_01389]|uniref:acyl carrier protein n=1 Tax=Microbispora sp. NBC_01389 TaxID=2903584 RepID=UPI00324C41BE
MERVIMWDERFETLLRKHLPFLPDGTQLTESSDLRDLGLDSMSMVDLLASLESTYQVRFRDDMLSLGNFATPGALWATLSTVT